MSRSSIPWTLRVYGAVPLAPALTGSALVLLLIPLASWSGGAVVERVIDSLLE